MASPDDFKDLEQRLTRAFRSHGDSIEPLPDAYSRLARAVNETPAGFRRIRGLLGPLRGGDGLLVTSGDSWRPLAFVAAIGVVAALGGYSLYNLASSPAETATAAPATAKASDLVARPGGSADDAETGQPGTGQLDGADSTSSDARIAGSADNPARSSVPSDAAAGGTASSIAGNPLERFAGRTYAPVRVTTLAAAEAFLDLLGIDDVVLEEQADGVIVSRESAVVTTLTVGAKGDGFMVVDARSDRLDLTIDSPTTIDPTSDDIVDDTVVSAPIEVSGTMANPGSGVTVSLRSVVDGSFLGRASAPPGVPGEDGHGYRLSLPVTGAERAWVVATVADADGGVGALAARSVLYTGRRDPSRYTVVGLPPDDPDGGLVVRSTPSGPQVGVIELGSTDVRRRPVPPRVVDGRVWWAIVDTTGLEGWAAARYLAVDENPAEATMIELARLVIAGAIEGDPTVTGRLGLRKPVFVGSIVDPRPVSGPADVRALLATRRKVKNGVGGSAVLADFYGFERWAEAEVFVPTGYREEGAAAGAQAFFGDLPSVVIRSFNPTTGGWERVHLFVSRDGDRPTLVGIVRESEPLPASSTEPEGPTTGPPSDTDG